MIFQKLQGTTWLAAGMLLASGADAKVKAMTGPQSDFAAYHTYQWLPPRVLTKTGLVENDPVVFPVIKAAVGRELAKRGLTEVQSGASLQVATWALRESIPQLEGFLYPGGFSAGGFGTDFGMPIATVSRYNHQGTLVVNLIDTGTKKSAWVALASGTFDKPEQLESKITKAAAQMFKKYPVKTSR